MGELHTDRIAAFYIRYVCQNAVDLPKNPCETSLQSIHMVQNVVDLLIRQKISCKAQFLNYMCVKTLLIRQKSLRDLLAVYPYGAKCC